MLAALVPPVYSAAVLRGWGDAIYLKLLLVVLDSCQRATSQGDAYNRANRPYSAKWRSKAMASVIPRRAMTTKLMASQSE